MPPEHGKRNALGKDIVGAAFGVEATQKLMKKSDLNKINRDVTNA
jgi:hypothetical protein